MLYGAMTETWPLIYRYDDKQKAVYAEAAERFRAAGDANEARVADDLSYRICRVERLVRCGPEGPEPARPTDPASDTYGPSKLHPTMDESGEIHYDE